MALEEKFEITLDEEGEWVQGGREEGREGQGLGGGSGGGARAGGRGTASVCGGRGEGVAAGAAEGCQRAHLGPAGGMGDWLNGRGAAYNWGKGSHPCFHQWPCGGTHLSILLYRGEAVSTAPKQLVRALVAAGAFQGCPGRLGHNGLAGCPLSCACVLAGQLLSQPAAMKGLRGCSCQLWVHLRALCMPGGPCGLGVGCTCQRASSVGRAWQPCTARLDVCQDLLQP
jgi:hypothetical protein